MAGGAERTRRSVAWGLCAALLAASAFVGGAWWGGERVATLAAPEAALDVVPGAASPGSHKSADSIGSAVMATTADWPPLPPGDAPLAEVFDELADRARRGDARAACRLGADLQRCALAYERRLTARDMETDLARRSDTPDRAVAIIDQVQNAAEQLGAGCDGLVPEQLAQAYQWQKHAAMLDPGLRVAFALSPALERRDFVNQLDLWSDYRSLALPWLEAAAKEGDVAAVIALARVHGDMRRIGPPVPPFRIEDDERFIVYADLMQRYGVEVPVVIREAAEKRARLSPEAQQRAAARAEELFRADLPLLDEAAANAAMGRSLRSVPGEGFCDE